MYVPFPAFGSIPAGRRSGSRAGRRTVALYSLSGLVGYCVAERIPRTRVNSAPPRDSPPYWWCTPRRFIGDTYLPTCESSSSSLRRRRGRAEDKITRWDREWQTPARIMFWHLLAPMDLRESQPSRNCTWRSREKEQSTRFCSDVILSNSNSDVIYIYGGLYAFIRDDRVMTANFHRKMISQIIYRRIFD